MCIYSVGIGAYMGELVYCVTFEIRENINQFPLETLKFVRGNYSKDEEWLSQMIQRVKTRYNVVTDLVGIR